jgi:hypothetical protein
MQAVFEDNVTINPPARVLLPVSQRVENNPGGGGAGEEGYPVQDRAGEEMRGSLIANPVTASAHGFDAS